MNEENKQINVFDTLHRYLNDLIKFYKIDIEQYSYQEVIDEYIEWVILRDPMKEIRNLHNVALFQNDMSQILLNLTR